VQVRADESVEHALLSCPQYSAARVSLFRDLQQLGFPQQSVTTSFILGRIIVAAGSPPDLRRQALEVTSSFLASINDLRSSPL